MFDYVHNRNYWRIGEATYNSPASAALDARLLPAYLRWRENITKPQKRDLDYERFLESEALEIDELISKGDI